MCVPYNTLFFWLSLNESIQETRKSTRSKYGSRLLQCGLTTLETMRLRGDQIEVFKIVNGYEDVDRNMFFKLKEGSRTSGHKAALVKIELTDI